VVFSCECADPSPLEVAYTDVGIDLGITHFAALSDGTFIENPPHYRTSEKVLQRRQQALSRKRRGSHRRDKARTLVAKAHRKVRNQRKDFHQKASRQLVNRYQVIVFEDLQAANLTRAPKPKQDEATGKYLPNGRASKAGLNKSILDAGWGMFTDMVRVKAAWAGRTTVFVTPKYTSQVCSGCGVIRKKELSERWHTCECGCSLDRDTNAAINIFRLGSSRQGAISVEAPAF
jgi:putative transposase